MDSPNTSALPYLGSKISLISNAEIRYEGILEHIDTMRSTVSLKNVRALGTEGRRPGQEVVPTSKTYECIIFKGKDIKDLTVCETANRVAEDPAIVSMTGPSFPSRHQHQMPMYHGHGGGQRYNGGIGRYADIENYDHSMYERPNYRAPLGINEHSVRMPHFANVAVSGLRNPIFGHAHQRISEIYPNQRLDGPSEQVVYPSHVQHLGGNRESGRTDRYTRRRIEGELQPHPNSAFKKEVAVAFNFEESNSKFDKYQQEEGSQVSMSKPAYDKICSFFDTISCETLDRKAGNDSRIDREEQRKIDTETFGAMTPIPRFNRTRGRGRGALNRRGRGGARYVPVSYQFGYDNASGYMAGMQRL